MNDPCEIASVLPPSEHFSPQSAGALALFAYEAAKGSAYQNSITVYGSRNEGMRPFSHIRYRGIDPQLEFIFGSNGGYARALADHFKQNPPQLIEVHNRVQIFNVLSKRVGNTPLCMHFHNDPLTIKGSQTPKQRWEILARAEAIYCCSDYIRRRFLTGLEAARMDHVHVVYHGIDPIKQVKKEPFILFVGRLIEEKGALELARAAQILLPHFPGWKIVFAGASRHGGKTETPYARAVYEALAPLGKQAVFLGQQPHAKIVRLYARAAIAVVPSIWNEPLGRTGIEALAAGCALVTSGHGGLAEIAGDCGVLVSPVTPEGLALALQGLLEDPETLRKIQQQCISRAPYFSLAGVRQQLDGLRQQLLNQAATG